jgi:hypothetical protein
LTVPAEAVAAPLDSQLPVKLEMPALLLKPTEPDHIPE